MFSELKILKLLIFILLLVFGFTKVNQRYQFTYIVLNKPIIKEPESFNLSIASSVDKSNFKINVQDLIKKKRVLDTVIDVVKTLKVVKGETFLETGYFSNENKVLIERLPSSIYAINVKIPLIISNTKKNNEVTIVYPYANNAFYTADNGKLIFDSLYTKTSLERQFEIDEWTQGLIPFFREISNLYKTNYITDLSLEKKENYFQSKVLIIYGNMVFWTPKMLANIQEYIYKGGRVLIASSELFYSKFYYNEAINKLSLLSTEKLNLTNNNKRESWYIYNEDSRNSHFFEFNHSRFCGNLNSFEGYKIEEPNHPIFKQINNDSLLFIGESFTGFKMSLKKKNIRQLASYYQENNNRVKNSGIWIVSYGRGKILNLGTSDLCLAINQQQDDIYHLFLNSVTFLMSR